MKQSVRDELVAKEEAHWEPGEVRGYVQNKARVKLKREAATKDSGYVTTWLVHWDGKLIGRVMRTGEYGRDPYPWNWYAEHENLTGNSDTRRDAISQLVFKVTGETVWY